MKRFVIALLFALTPLTCFAANEVVFNYGTTGSTLYFVDFNASGQAWDTTGTPAYEAFTTARGDYDIALTEVSGTGLYRGSLPASAGIHRYTIYLQAGGSPNATDDIAVAEGEMYFDLTEIGDEALAGAIENVDPISSGGPFLNEMPGEAFTSKLGTRRDGTYTVDRPCRVRAGETVVWAVDCAALLRGGRYLDTMNTPAEDSNADITVGTTAGTNYGVNRTLALVTVTAQSDATGTGSVVFDVTFGSSTVAITLPVKVLE
jgi:hypothetical protein